MNQTLIRQFALVALVLMGATGCSPVKEVVFTEIRNTRIEKLGFASSILKADLVYYNPNSFGVELRNAEFDLYLNQTFLGRSRQTTQVQVPRRQSFVLPVEMELDMKNLLKNGITALFNKEVTLQAKGQVRVGKGRIFRTFPVDYSTKQRLSPF